MAYRVAIVDDSSVDAAFVEDILTAWAEERQVVVQPERFEAAEKFLFRYAEDKAWDILLLDIEMGAMDGVTMAKKVRAHNEAVQIVFITGYADYIAEGYPMKCMTAFMMNLFLCRPRQTSIWQILRRWHRAIRLSANWRRSAIRFLCCPWTR